MTDSINAGENNPEKTIGRRQLLKAIAAAGGAVTAASVVPGQWAKPVIEAGMLPAHAQSSFNLTAVITNAGIGITGEGTSADELEVTITVTPAQAGISITDQFTVGNFLEVGPQTTDGSGQAIFTYFLCDVFAQNVAGQGVTSGPFTIKYTFTDQATYGSASDTVSGTFDPGVCFG